MTSYLLIACGGGAGAVCRFVLAGWGQRLTESTFPAGTLLVNVVGCLAIGFFASVLAGPAIIREEYRFAILVGFLGGFTTFSTFGYETVALLADRDWWYAIGNVMLSNGVGLIAVWLGSRLALLWPGV